MTKILILDVETDGLDGAPADRVLEVGVAELDTADDAPQAVRAVYSQVIRYEDPRDCWIFHHSTLTPAEVLGASADPKQAARILREIVRGRLVTSYNVGFDFGRFLDRRPWVLGRAYDAVPLDIMYTATSTARDLFD